MCDLYITLLNKKIKPGIYNADLRIYQFWILQKVQKIIPSKQNY